MIGKLERAVIVWLCAMGQFVSHAPAQPPYDIAAYVWPAYQPDARFKDIGVFKDGKGEWEAI